MLLDYAATHVVRDELSEEHAQCIRVLAWIPFVLCSEVAADRLVLGADE
jgi:hypothetical protein